ncbi:MAG: hypothetical protein HeimAB125_05790 [Candidatus Heimdallarchaeota archaeon AB_125]|nr:MAG: hypothetical protein HeimAB125_05790 [Candidatus Heimdallarchaeota archaeon AB_125]
MQDVKLHVGCTGFNYDDWKSHLGGFYPAKIDKFELLDFYSTQFTTCEINSTFYAFPKLETTARWNKSLPDDFVLTAKIPKAICQADNLSVVDQNLKSFLHVMSPLKKKLGPLVMQLKPSFEKTDSTREQIFDFVSFFPHSEYQLIVEFRHNSWYNEDTYDLLNEKEIGIVSSFLPYIKFNLFEEVKKEHFYLRLIGSHQQQIGLGKELKDRTSYMEDTADNLLQAFQNNSNKSTGYVFINNHFSGYAPPAARKFKEILKEKKIVVVEPQKTVFKGQQKLADFFGS